MDNFVFKHFINWEVAQKIIIFADAFNLNINAWKADNTPEHPYRINFYSHNLLVGYLDIIASPEHYYVSSDMPFVLFTPFGKVTGVHSSHFGNFAYQIENRPDAFTQIDGVFKVKNNSSLKKKEYAVESRITLTTTNEQKASLDFNRTNGNFDLKIGLDTGHSYELITLYQGGGAISVEHDFFVKVNVKETLTRAVIDLNTPHLGDFYFSNKEHFTKPIGFLTDGKRRVTDTEKAAAVDIRDVLTTINEHDPRFSDFISEVREMFTLPANGITPISLYDKMSHLSYNDKDDAYKLVVAQAQNIDTVLTDNGLKKRRTPKKPH